VFSHLMFSQVFGAGSFVRAIFAGVTFSMFSCYMILEDQGTGAGVTALIALMFDAQVLGVNVLLQLLVTLTGEVTVHTMSLLMDLLRLLIWHQVNPLLMCSEAALVYCGKAALITIICFPIRGMFVVFMFGDTVS